MHDTVAAALMCAGKRREGREGEATPAGGNEGGGARERGKERKRGREGERDAVTNKCAIISCPAHLLYAITSIISNITTMASSTETCQFSKLTTPINEHGN